MGLLNTRAIIKLINALPKEQQAEVFEMVHRLEDDAIPESFWQGLDDIQHGRVVDMETTLRDRPPKWATTSKRRRPSGATFTACRAGQKAAVRRVWKIFKANPFDPGIGVHKNPRPFRQIWQDHPRPHHRSRSPRGLPRGGHTVFTVDIGTHAIYRT